MNRQFYFFCFIILLPLSLFAQKKGTPQYLLESSAKFGISDASLFDQLMGVVPGVGKSSKALIQRQSVKSYMMPVRDIGMRGESVAFIAANCMEFYVNLDRNYKVNLSPDYISLNLANVGQKVNPAGVFQFLASDGTVSAAILPYGSTKLTSGVYATEKYKVRNYLHLFRNMTRGRQRIFETRKALLRGHPVMVEIRASEKLKNTKGDRYWEPDAGETQKYPLVIVGYDELEEAFEATSCWGRKWGDNGYIWIHYSDFEKYAENGYVLVMDH